MTTKDVIAELHAIKIRLETVTTILEELIEECVPTIGRKTATELLSTLTTPPPVVK